MFKYVIVKNEMGVEVPLIFPETINHSTVSKFGNRGEHECASAGFCAADEVGRWSAWGESITLRLKSRPDIDGKILTEAFGKLS